MKINWGTGIAIAIGLFMVFILFFVYLVQSDVKYDNEMVTEEYYKKESELQGQINKEQNAMNLTNKVQITDSLDVVAIRFPKNFEATKITGTIFMYRPSNEKLDYQIPLKLSNSVFFIPKKEVAKGRWDISIDWTYEKKSYLNKMQLNLK